MNRRTSRIPRDHQQKLISSVLGPPSARRAVRRLGLNRHTVRLYFHKLREVMAVKVDEEFREVFGDRY